MSSISSNPAARQQFQANVQRLRSEAREAGHECFETKLGQGDATDVGTRGKYYAICNGMQEMRAQAAALKAQDNSAADRNPAANVVETENTRASFDEESGQLTSFRKQEGSSLQQFESQNGVMLYSYASERGGLGLVADNQTYEAVLFSRYAR